MEPLATTQNVLHPRQVQEMSELKRQRESVLQQPSYIREQVANPQAIAKEIRQIDDTLQREAPQPIPESRLDEAVKLEKELRASWLEGMPSQAEYRRNTSGAVDKHRAWEAAKKEDVLKWKHLRRRLHATGISEHGLADEGDVSNVEKFRPRDRAVDTSDAQIPQTRTIFQAPPGAAPAVVLSDVERDQLRAVDPELADQIALLDNEQRAKVKDILAELNAPSDSIKTLRTEAKALGINTFGMSKDQIKDAIHAKAEG